jgi:hypothetical protein
MHAIALLNVIDPLAHVELPCVVINTAIAMSHVPIPASFISIFVGISVHTFSITLVFF